MQKLSKAGTKMDHFKARDYYILIIRTVLTRQVLTWLKLRLETGCNKTERGRLNYVKIN